MPVDFQEMEIDEASRSEKNVPGFTSHIFAHRMGLPAEDELRRAADVLNAGSKVTMLVGRGALRNPWIFTQAAELVAGRQPREITSEERGRFLLDYIDLLLRERVDEADGFRHVAPGQMAADGHGPARGHDRWVINKLRALNSWYTKGIDNGSHLRVAVNAADSIARLRAIIEEFFLDQRNVPALSRIS